MHNPLAPNSQQHAEPDKGGRNGHRCMLPSRQVRPQRQQVHAASATENWAAPMSRSHLHVLRAPALVLLRQAERHIQPEAVCAVEEAVLSRGRLRFAH